MADDNQSSQSTGDQNATSNNNQDTQPKWVDQLPENLRSNEKLTKFEKLGDLGNAFIDLDGKYNPDAILVPGEDATDEDRATFFNKVGRPDAPDGYQFDETQWPENIAENVREMTKTDIDAFRETFHKLGLTQAQAKELQSTYVSSIIDKWNEGEKAKAEFRDKSLADFKNEWGDKSTENIEVAHRTFIKGCELAGIDKNQAKSFMDDSGLGNHPFLVKPFLALGKAIGDDSIADVHTQTKMKGNERGPDGRPRLSFPSMEGKAS